LRGTILLDTVHSQQPDNNVAAVKSYRLSVHGTVDVAVRGTLLSSINVQNEDPNLVPFQVEDNIIESSMSRSMQRAQETRSDVCRINATLYERQVRL
jgi:hypothetical protein